MENPSYFLSRHPYREKAVNAYPEAVWKFLRVLGNHYPSSLPEYDLARDLNIINDTTRQYFNKTNKTFGYTYELDMYCEDGFGIEMRYRAFYGNIATICRQTRNGLCAKSDKPCLPSFAKAKEKQRHTQANACCFTFAFAQRTKTPKFVSTFQIN